MAKAVESTGQAATIGYNEADYQWDTVHVEVPDRLVMDAAGDKYIGEYLGHEVIHPVADNTAEWFIQLSFKDNDGTKVMNAGYELRTTFVTVETDDENDVLSTKDNIPPHSIVKIELRKLVDVDQPSPMKSYQVDVASNTRA